MEIKDERQPRRRMDRTISTDDSQPSKRRRLSLTHGLINLLGPSKSPPPFVMPRSSGALSRNGLTRVVTDNRQPFTIPISRRNKIETGQTAASAAPVAKPSPQPMPLPKLKDSALTSDNIEAAICLIEKNTAKKQDKFEEVLQSFHDLYRWSRLPNRLHRKFFLHEFVWELSGIPRVMQFLKAHKMGDEFLSQLLQTEFSFDE